MDNNDRILPLSVAGGTALLLALAGFNGVTGRDASEAAQTELTQAAETVSTAVDSVSDTVADTAAAAGEAVQEIAEDTAEAVTEAADDLVEETVEVAEETAVEVEETAEAVVDATEETAQEAVEAAETAVEDTVEVAEEAAVEVEETAEATVEATEETVQETVEAAETVVEEVVEATEDAAVEVEQTAEAVVESTEEAAQESAASVETAVEDTIEATEDAAASAVEVTEDAVEDSVAAVSETAGATAADGAALAGAAAESLFDMDAMSDADKAAFGAQVRAYLMANPEVIIEAVNTLEQRQAEAQAAADVQLVQDNLEALLNDPDSWVGGNPEGDVTIVEFMDYRCSFCRRAAPEVEELIASDGNIRLIVKELPILGQASLVSSRFAIAARLAAGPDAYKAVHDALMDLNGEPTEPVLRRVAEGLELDADAIFAAMNDASVDEQIGRTRALAQRMQINGTPTFVFGDQLVRGYVPLDGMRQIVDEERAAASE